MSRLKYLYVEILDVNMLDVKTINDTEGGLDGAENR